MIGENHYYAYVSPHEYLFLGYWNEEIVTYAEIVLYGILNFDTRSQNYNSVTSSQAYSFITSSQAYNYNTND